MRAPIHQDWYLHEWFATAGKKQRDLITGLDWLPAKANKIWHGLQPPKVHEAAEIAAYLNIRTHELFMPPEEAMRIRRIEVMLKDAAQSDPPAPIAAPTLPTPARRKAG